MKNRNMSSSGGETAIIIIGLTITYTRLSYINSYMFYFILFSYQSHFYHLFVNNLVLARVLLRLKWVYSQIESPYMLQYLIFVSCTLKMAVIYLNKGKRGEVKGQRQ